MKTAALLSELIKIPSVNPDGEPGTSRVGEEPVACFVRSFLETCGATTEMRDVLPGRPNVLARFPSDRPGKPKLLLAPHTDTVSVLGMTIEPFSGEIRDGKVWGRGASDTKGSMASMLQALQDLQEEIPSLPYEIWFAGLMGEEAGLHGSKALSAQETFDFVIVGEPTEMKAVHAHKGATWIQITTSGRSAHASIPETGINAIDAALGVIATLKSQFAIRAAANPDPLLGVSTLSVGTIHGGSKTNIVPNRCEVSIDTRIAPGLDIHGLIADIRAEFPEVGFEYFYSPPLLTDPKHPLLQKMQTLGIPTTTAPWFCDAAPFGEKGIPAIALGPGSIAQAHTADEWISLTDLEAGTEGFKTILRNLPSQISQL
jgi:acetylornithine deacetylase/succinyl-diaminopimelate desuccinylase-like protein